jgi:hypothetical protein
MKAERVAFDRDRLLSFLFETEALSIVHEEMEPRSNCCYVFPAEKYKEVL